MRFRTLAVASIAALCAARAQAQPAGYHQVYSDVPLSAADIADGSSSNIPATANWFTNVEQCCSGSQYTLSADATTPPGETAPTYPFAFGPHSFQDILQFHPADGGSPYPYFTTGIVTSTDATHLYGHAWKYGYFEWTARVPADTVPGTWPGLYFKSTDQQNHNFELDVMEHYGAFPGAYSATMTNWQEGWALGCNPDPLPSGDLAAIRHRYGLLWTPTAITFYFDGQPVCGPFDATSPVFNNPAYAIMDVGEGGAGGRNDPSGLPPTSVFKVFSFTVSKPN